MKNTWQLQQAKSRFCAVAEQAGQGHPQMVTKHGRPFVVIVGADTWRKTRQARKAPLAALRSCPADLTGLDLARSRELPREVVL